MKASAGRAVHAAVTRSITRRRRMMHKGVSRAHTLESGRSRAARVALPSAAWPLRGYA
jgi:hypothetical protein